ncbi:DUF349 domain-containing protein [Paraglaciecola aquimarina]|uniref:DUF349 domain-containing protein n=1 Tax=Paraglaciecola algarum TaxID=3050085 RepID=A0ABS9D3R9_9ALTE|nr:DUF349 domain-containing protein [Paraglaciecola sp. G1-23]MCF2946672.1 DUF349 domain-containing protein [Paraglaciecola sp. G1-23]
MIFKHLFRSKHQSPNPQVRIQAIENLNQQDPEQKSILHELAFNDSDVNVSLAALQKLDSFVLWYKMAEIAKNDRVQKRSQQIVEDTLLTEQGGQLDIAEKRKFVLECRDNRLIEKLLMQNWVQQDTELAMQQLQKLVKPQLQEKLLIETTNLSLQLAILSELQDGPQQRKLLNKLIRKSSADSLKKEAQKRLDAWLLAESRPLEIDKKVKMILSRLLVLKDSQDLPLIKAQQQELVAEYQLVSEEFSCLTELKRSEINQKFTDITKKVNHVIEQLEPKWQAKLAELELQKNINDLVHEIKQTLSKVSEQLKLRMNEINHDEANTFNMQISEHCQKLQTLTKQIPLNNTSQHKKLEGLHQELLASRSTLENLPEFQNALKVAHGLIEKFSALPLPSDHSQIEAAQDFSNELKQQWWDAIGGYKEFIPADVSKVWSKRNNQWQAAIKQLKSQVDADLTRVRNKIRAVDSLVNQGKFKAAMGLYQKVQLWYSALPEKQQAKLEKSFVSVKEQIENLQDWQEYIAAPRKPALLKEVESLLVEPLAVDDQAKQIKSLRAQWNSLGKLETEADEALNIAFDQAVEKAFEPCRIHYEQQQKERAQNLLEKQSVLASLSELNQSTVDQTQIAKSLRALQQKWRNIGEVDYKLRAELYEQYQALVTPLKDKVNQFYLDNQEQKQKLVDKALKLQELESIEEAIEQVKKLQEQWKTIAHAGRKAETTLWPAFREANDQIFAKRNAASQLQKDQVNQQVSQVKAKLSEMEKALSQAKDTAEIQSALQDKLEVNQLSASLPLSEQKTVERRLQQLVEQQQSKLTDLKAAEKVQHFKDIFSILGDWQQDSDLTEKLDVLPKAWQACFVNTNTSVDRQELVLKMEILAEVESPKGEMAKRKGVQMQLMADKLQTGQALNLNTLFKEWISAGKLDDQSQLHLPRLRRVFLS